MTNLLNLEDYNKIKQEKFEENKAKVSWKLYKKFGLKSGSKQHKKFQARYQAKKKGVSVH